MEPSDEARAYLQWRVPRSVEDRLPAFLQELEASAASLSIADVQISLTSLEEVCFTILGLVSFAFSDLYYLSRYLTRI